MRMRWVLPLAWLALAGCARETGFAAAGEYCVRAAECMPGLACVGGQCSADLSGLEGGVVPFPRDAGRGIDAGASDAAPGVDSGPPPMIDGGPPPSDAGRDSGPPPLDAGRDSGPPDSGPPPPPDSGPPDSGPPPPDAA